VPNVTDVLVQCVEYRLDDQNSTLRLHQVSTVSDCLGSACLHIFYSVVSWAGMQLKLKIQDRDSTHHYRSGAADLVGLAILPAAPSGSALLSRPLKVRGSAHHHRLRLAESQPRPDHFLLFLSLLAML